MLTLSLAAKTVCVVLAAQTAKPSSIDQSIALLGDSLRPSGVAVLVDSRGYFVAASLLKTGPTIEATMPDGTRLLLTFVSSDEVSQLSLLLAGDWKPDLGFPIRLAKNFDVKDRELVLVSGSQRFKGEFAGRNKIGILADSSRYVPLNEMRFESQTRPTGGAPIFNSKGELAGFINASVVNVSSTESAVSNRDSFEKSDSSSRGRMAKNYGPAGLTVSYSFNEKVLSRVIEGFLSNDHQPKHPYLGVFYQNHMNGGIEIRTVTKGSPSDEAGLKVGDILQSLNGEKVSDSFVFASKIFEMSVGDRASFKVLRSGITMSVDVTIGQFTTSKTTLNSSATPNLAKLEQNFRLGSTTQNGMGKNMISLSALVQNTNLDSK